MTLTWTPQESQSGPQGFCAGAIDNHNLQSDPWCITYLVDYTSPNLIRPILVQGSASPLGTVFSNQSLFSIMGTYKHSSRQLFEKQKKNLFVFF